MFAGKIQDSSGVPVFKRDDCGSIRMAPPPKQRANYYAFGDLSSMLLTSSLLIESIAVFLAFE